MLCSSRDPDGILGTLKVARSTMNEVLLLVCKRILGWTSQSVVVKGGGGVLPRQHATLRLTGFKTEPQLDRTGNPNGSLQPLPTLGKVFDVSHPIHNVEKALRHDLPHLFSGHVVQLDHKR